MAAADVALPPPNWAALQQQLNKKATFEATTKALAEQQRHLSDPAARALLARCRQLLKARYTGRPFWVAGRQLFQAALPAASGDAAFQQELQVRWVGGWRRAWWEGGLDGTRACWDAGLPGIWAGAERGSVDMCKGAPCLAGA